MQLRAIENFIDDLFQRLGIDVRFTNYFKHRINDMRNRPPISIRDLAKLFSKEFKRWGPAIAKLDPGAEGVMKDLSTNVNIPFQIKWDHRLQSLEMIPKTIMRKEKFFTPDKIYPVEDAAGVGTITKTNTTKDVKPGETRRQAKKFQLVELSIPDEMETLGLDRGMMPQIETEQLGDFASYMKGNGITCQCGTINPNNLIPIQKDFHEGKIKSTIQNGDIKPIIISGDNYIIDGHHRWSAAQNAGERIKCLKVNAPVGDVFMAATNFCEHRK